MKTGDRVRVVLEGEIRRNSNGTLHIGAAGSLYANTIRPADEHVVSVEVLPPPLPTEFGSVIERSTGVFLVYDGAFWRYMDGSKAYSSDFEGYDWKLVRDGVGAEDVNPLGVGDVPEA